MNSRNLRKQKNLLRDFIFKGSSKEFSKQTIKGLFRSIVETVVEAPSQEALVVFKLNDNSGLSSVLKRLEFSSSRVCSFGEIEGINIENVLESDIFEDTEFVLVLAPRYSASLVWDYSISQNGCSEISLIYNSRTVSDVAKVILENSKEDLSEFLVKFAPDRRENELLNVAITKLASCYDGINEEILLTNAEKTGLEKNDKLFKEYEYTSDKAKSISHEIKNHLSVIDLYSKIIDKRVDKTDEETAKSLENAIRSINNSVYSITQYLSELKTFAKPILSEKKLSLIFEDVVNSVLPKAELNNTKIIVELKDDIRVHVDEVKIQSVLINLLYNAIEAIKQNGKVYLSCTEIIDNCARIVVTDTGEGIKPENVERIFEKEFTTKITGNGIGLYLSKELMKEQYGDLKLIKSDDSGTQMEVLVPTI